MGCMLVTALAAGCAQEDIGNDPSEGVGYFLRLAQLCLTARHAYAR